MNFSFNIYSIFLIFFGIITIFFSYYIYKKESGAVRFFGLMMFSNAIWSLGYGLELASPTLRQALFFIDIEYIGIATIPLNWSLFCLKLSGKDNWYKKPLNISLLIAITVITMLLVWTNDYHHLHFKGYSMDTTGDFPLVNLHVGPTYWIFTIYFYLVLLAGCYLLTVKFRKSDPIYQRQNNSIVIAAFIPLVANVIYIFNIRPFGNMDITPFAFIASILLITVAIYRYKLFDIVPVAREKVLDLMRDGFIILDNKHRVIDHNRALRKYLPDHGNSKIIGTSIEMLVPGQTELFEFLKENKPGKLELKIEAHNRSFDLEADIDYLNENQSNREAIIIKLQDLTVLRAESLKTKMQAEELSKLNQLKDKIFSIIAHDLRGPFVNLSEVLKIISNNQISLEELREISPTLSKDILYTTDLLENILHWSRSQLKGYGINKEFFDLKGLIVNEVTYHLPSASAKKIEIIQDVFPGAMVYADVIMMQIVVRNILNNAIKFCRGGCMIHITSVYTKDRMIKLCVKDNGMGMSEEFLDKLFKGENQSTRGTMNEKGTGLGLVVCKEFIEKNDGTLIIHSKLDVGSEFCICLPVDDK